MNMYILQVIGPTHWIVCMPASADIPYLMDSFWKLLPFSTKSKIYLLKYNHIINKKPEFCCRPILSVLDIREDYKGSISISGL